MLFLPAAPILQPCPPWSQAPSPLSFFICCCRCFARPIPRCLRAPVKIGGGVLALAVAAFTGIKGELAVAIPIGIFGAGLLGWAPFGTPGFGQIGGLFGAGAAGQRSNGQASRVRSRFFEMTLDHDTGALTGDDWFWPQCRPLAEGFRSFGACWPCLGNWMPKACRYLKAIWTAGYPPGVRTRKETRQAGNAARRRAAK